MTCMTQRPGQQNLSFAPNFIDKIIVACWARCRAEQSEQNLKETDAWHLDTLGYCRSQKILFLESPKDRRHHLKEAADSPRHLQALSPGHARVSVMGVLIPALSPSLSMVTGPVSTMTIIVSSSSAHPNSLSGLSPTLLSLYINCNFQISSI